MKKEYDEIDLKVKKLLGINPYPNKCLNCGMRTSYGHKYQITKFEINTKDGNIYCPDCHQPVGLGRIDRRALKNNDYKMNTLRKKNG